MMIVTLLDVSAAFFVASKSFFASFKLPGFIFQLAITIDFMREV